MSEQIFVHRDGKSIELKGAELEAFFADKILRQAEAEAQEQENTARAAARQTVLDKLELTADEAAALFG